ncbi:Uncharacterised protein [Mycobacteroides abscessus subsp. abscessus]|nr:Uncharacterised protein [Mycobacteroides abscessus subsp. abscessus]
MWAAADFGQLSGHGGEIATGRIASYGDSGWVRTQFGGVFCRPAECGKCVIDSGWVGVFRCESVIHRHHHRFDMCTYRPCHPVVSIDTAQRETAAVIVEDKWEFSGAFKARWPVDAHRNRGCIGDRNRGVLHTTHRGQLRIARGSVAAGLTCQGQILGPIELYRWARLED